LLPDGLGEAVPLGVLRTIGREAGAIAIRLAAYLGTLAVIAIVLIRLFPIARSEALVAAPVKPQWAAMERPYAAYAVAFPDILDPKPGYTVLRSMGGGRKDIATFEGKDTKSGRAAGRSAMIEIYRPGSEFTGFQMPRDEIVALASQAGTVEGAANAPAIESRFGPMALVDFTLTSDGVQRGCLGFVGRTNKPQLQIAGWFCNAGPGMVARPAVVCGLDRLTLLSAGNDPRLAQFFAQAELKAATCNPRYASAGTPFRQPDWLTGRHEAPLRRAARN
jgi:hypothetical protein